MISSPTDQPSAVTLTVPETAERFACEVNVSADHDRRIDQAPPSGIACLGLWDTGASGSMIAGWLAADLQLEASETIAVATAGGVFRQDAYYIKVLLPNSIAFNGLLVTEADLEGLGLLIGMDIISLGDFAITHKGDDLAMVMTYRTPPNYGRIIDFELEINS